MMLARLFQKRCAFMGDEKIVHVGGVILLVGEDVLEHDARRGIVVAEIADQLLIMFDHQAFGDQIVLDHLHEIAAVAVFGRSTAGEALRIKIGRSEEHTSEIQSLMRISYAVFCLKKKKNATNSTTK